MKQSIRHKKIIEQVKLNGYASTEQLVAILKVSPQTIRRDLNELAEQNLIRRHHGGAASPSNSENSDYTDRKDFFSLEKNLIAQQAALMIPEGASLFIDIGTTPEAVANALLNHKKLRIVTNNLNAAHLLRQNETFDITVAGGSLRRDGGVMGEATVAFISQFRLDFAILGISSIDHDGSLLDYDYHEVQVKRAIIENSRTTLLVADHSKFSRRAIVRLGSVADVDYVLTDTTPPQTVLDLMASHHVELKLCQAK
ncbi:DeoR/GlpR family transcriptional regulator [Volucribacter amazonae]|uniref:Transcriptional regulator n=1 Tax=Volucribacter amazonae TaxID=256731 RepID=A0A9X4PDC8_9PAST|nr:DeoR/GlpR family transcriptional regulator [Volucribacter amazonae]MDG6895311.1 transcriptional regulator [Volucribacter amazonae]